MELTIAITFGVILFYSIISYIIIYNDYHTSAFNYLKNNAIDKASFDRKFVRKE